MSPAKQKSKDRQTARDQKAVARQVAVNGGTVTSAYNPLSGTFHTLESVSTDTGTGFVNGKFKCIDDVDDNSSSNGGGTEVECMSNNGSCSGESEDIKDKHGIGIGKGGSDKRNKIRGKNERKHQRQKEKRAQELRDKCTSYLMSRKLEALSQQLVAMGFSQERSTMALILNDGHVERSVSWLLEGSESHINEDWNAGSNPKIDISEELGKILETEKKYKLERSDIERAIVSCEGDLDKALKSLQVQSRSSSPNCNASSEDSSENIKEEIPAQTQATMNEQAGLQSRNTVASQLAYPIKRDEKITSQPVKGRVQGTSTHSYTSLQSRKIPDPFTDMQNWPGPAEIRGHVQGPRIPLASVRASSSQSSQYRIASNTDNGLTFSKPVTIASRDSAFGTLSKDPVVIARPPTMLTNTQSSVTFSSCPVSPSSSWGTSVTGTRSPSSVLPVPMESGNSNMKTMKAGMVSSNTLGFMASDIHAHFSFASVQPEPLSLQWSSYVGDGLQSETSIRDTRSSSGSSYGLFTGWGAGVAPPSVDWSTGPSSNFDYWNIDWSMKASPNIPQNLSSTFNSLNLQQRDSHYWNSGDDRRIQTGIGAASLIRNSTNGHGICRPSDTSSVALQDRFYNESAKTATHEWTSPFTGKDLFNLPQTVPSASL